jgi:hypothetical protein
MRQMQLAALILEQLGQPLPAIGRFQREPGVLAELGQQPAKHLRIVREPPRQSLAAVLLDNGDMRALAMQVDPDVHHARASLGPGTQHAPGA